MTSYIYSLRIGFSKREYSLFLPRLARLRLLSNHTLSNHRLLSMPAPSRTSSKRKIESDEESDPEVGISQSSQISKKSRKEKNPVPESNQPTNKVLPAQIVLPEKLSGTSRVVTWNVSGFAASAKKVNTRFFARVVAKFDSVFLQGFKHYLEAEDPDILIITETKVY